MSIRASLWAFDQGIDTTSKFVLVALADFADEQWTCWPSVCRLARMTCLSERSVRNALRSLEEAGLIETQHREGATSRFRLIHGNMIPYEPKASDMNTRGRNVVQGGISAQEPRNLTSETPEPDSPKPSYNHQEPPSVVAKAPIEPKREEVDLLGTPVSKVKTNGRDAPKSRRSPKGPHEIPEDWFPSNRDLAYAEERGVDPYTTMDRFKHHHRAKGTKYKRWDLAWQTWIQNCQEWRKDLL